MTSALERAFEDANEPFDYAVYIAGSGWFVHVPWGERDSEPVATTILEPRKYVGFPIDDDGQLERTIIVKIHGGADGQEGGVTWRNNYVVTEDHYIDYLPTHNIQDHLPIQILDKLTGSRCLFLGYGLRNWNSRVFLRRIWRGKPITRELVGDPAGSRSAREILLERGRPRGAACRGPVPTTASASCARCLPRRPAVGRWLNGRSEAHFRGLGFYTEDDARWFFGRDDRAQDHPRAPAHRPADAALRRERSGQELAAARRGCGAAARAGACRNRRQPVAEVRAAGVQRVEGRPGRGSDRGDRAPGAACCVPASNGDGSEPTSALPTEASPRPTSHRGFGAPRPLDATLVIILDQFEEHFSYRLTAGRPDRLADELAQLCELARRCRRTS